MDLAEQVIQANENDVIETEEQSVEDYYTDDMGFLVEKRIRKDKMKFAKYIYTRCRRLNPTLHLRRKIFLYNGHTLIRDNPLDIAKLADLAEQINSAQAAWVYKRLVATVPELKDDKIEILPGLLWNLETLELEDSSWGDYDTIKQERKLG